MTNTNSKEPHSGVFKKLRMILLGLATLVTSGCGPGSGDGVVVNGITLPTGTLLNFACANVGIYTETCVLGDTENPFATAVINEFDANNPNDPSFKFNLLTGINNQIPNSVDSAKTRFYLWATALARNPMGFAAGENQWYAARALHELWAAAGDPLVQAQALKAYRSVLDNYFTSVTFFDFILPPSSYPLKELVGADLYCQTSPFTCLFPFPGNVVPAGPNEDLATISSWGYTYNPAIPLMTSFP